MELWSDNMEKFSSFFIYDQCVYFLDFISFCRRDILRQRGRNSQNNRKRENVYISTEYAVTDS